MSQLAGKTALVTGGGTGIGRATALLLAAEGARVAVSGRRRAPLEEVVREIERAGGEGCALAADLAEPQGARGLARRALERLGRVDVLVNNAGASSRVRNVRHVGQEEWDRILAANLTGVFALTQALLPSMLERGEGAIVTISSVAALRPGLLGGAPYGAAKAAVANLMGHVRAVLRNRGIRATTIFPAEVDTPILENRPLVPGAAERATMLQPEDVARAVLFCAALPPRAVVEEMTIAPSHQRDLGADLEAAERAGAPPGEPA